MTDPMRQFQQRGINVNVFADKHQLGAGAADFVAQTIRDTLSKQSSARVIFATGASQYEFLDALVQMNDVDWSRVTAFHLDEYLNLSIEHPASFRRYLQERLFSKLPFAAVHMLDGTAADPQAECQRYTDLLRQGPVDLACIGIGENGHLAFNDPPADFDTSALVQVVELDVACRQQQVGEGHFATFDDVPTHALSLSVPAILQAGVISCVVPDQRKAAAVQCALEGPVEPTCPASALQKHADVQLFLDAQSASALTTNR